MGLGRGRQGLAKKEAAVGRGQRDIHDEEKVLSEHVRQGKIFREESGRRG
jgi:hypothetical protein